MFMVQEVLTKKKKTIILVLSSFQSFPIQDAAHWVLFNKISTVSEVSCSSAVYTLIC